MDSLGARNCLNLDKVYSKVLVQHIIFDSWSRQEAAGALWNLSFDDRNREAIAAAGGVEALVRSLTLYYKLFIIVKADWTLVQCLNLIYLFFLDKRQFH